MSLTPAEKLRLLNLAYMQMQADFKRFLPELFRGPAQALTTNASGYALLSADSFEVELVVVTSSKIPLERISKEFKYQGTGWYHDGIDTATGKRRLMFRQAGAAWPSLAVTIDTLIEFPELTALDGTPYPFVQSRYLNMLTELQTFMFLMEQGKEQAPEAERHWNVYQYLLGQAKKDMLDKRPEFMASAHADAGDSHNSPALFN